MNKLWPLLLTLLMVPLSAAAEGVENVRFAVEGDRVLVRYDLVGTGVYDVELWLSRDGGEVFDERPGAVAGHVGDGVEAGAGRQIRWDVLADWPAGLTGEAFVFEVRAWRRRDRRLVWAGAGLAAGAAGVAVLVAGDKEPQRGRIVIDVADPEE